MSIGARSLIEGPNPVTRPEQLAGLTALIHRDMPDTFSAWRHAAGLDELEPLAIDHFDSGALMLEAAAQGLGIAFMHASHFDEAHDPRLVRAVRYRGGKPLQLLVRLPPARDATTAGEAVPRLARRDLDLG